MKITSASLHRIGSDYFNIYSPRLFRKVMILFLLCIKLILFHVRSQLLNELSETRDYY